MPNPICPYCKRESQFVDSSIIYGKSYGMIYLCSNCDAYVGCHNGTNKAKGTLANKELRELRKKAHECFDPLWKNGSQSRSSAYKWLSKQLNIPFSKTHIAMFNEEQCKKVIALTQAGQKC
ncbi:MAG: zinc-finger-containing protein [Snowella sp.]|nr:zinc-finger-containing protein [Snowella sp.]